MLVHRHSFSRDNQALNDYLLATEHAGDLYTYDNRGKMTEKRVLVSMDESGEPVYAVIQYVYDAEENLVKEYVYKNGFGAEEKPEGEARIITREYDASGRLVSISDNSGASIERTYDSNDCLVREVKAVDEIRREITEYEYDGCQRVLARRVKETKASNYVST